MSIRLRLALTFAAAAAVLFALGSWLFVTMLSSSLLSAVDVQLSAQLTVARRYLPAGGAPAARAGAPLPGEAVVQVLDAAGRVRGASADADPGALLSGAQLRRARAGRIALTANDQGERERILAGPLGGRPARPGWVAVAATSLDAPDGTESEAARSLAGAGLVLVALAGLGAYGLARAALSPVERLRREVAALSERDRAPGVRVPRTRDEIAALAVTMNDLLGRLQRALVRQRELVADASHELRTPLAVLSGELELAGRPGRSPAELAEAVTRAGEEAARLARLTGQLLFLARSDEGARPLRREPTSLAALLAGSAGHAALRAAAAGVSCTVDAPADLTASVDPDQIREAVDNLVDNAVRFAPAGTSIRIGARADGPDLVIEVRDQGPGFPPDFLAHAFERFRRPGPSRRRADGGAGLGLAIVSAIAREHEGRATARNLAGGGAAVGLELPGAAVPRAATPPSGT